MFTLNVNILRLALVGAVLLPFVLADDLFAGCYATYPSITNPPPAGSRFRDSSSACTLACTQTSHSYYNASSRECFCSNGTPFQRDLRPGNKNDCGVNYDNRITVSSFMELEPLCTATRPEGLTNIQQFTGLNGCLRACANGLRATFWANTAANNYFCGCQTPTSYGAGTTCSANSFFGFYHTPEAAASGLTRRKQKEELAARNSKPVTYCPNGYTACLIDGFDNEAYECIDTSSDLESCGGCRHGEFNNFNGTIGADCTEMPGAVFGGSTCAAGKCVAFGCKRGFRLVDGECVRRSGAAGY